MPLPLFEKEYNRRNASREWKVLNATYGVRYRKIGDDVEINVNAYAGNKFIFNELATVELGVLPAECIPNLGIRLPVYTESGNTKLRFAIETNGQVNLFNWGTPFSTQVVNTYVKYTV